MGWRELDCRMAKSIDKVKESVEDLGEAVRILGLGIDYRNPCNQ